MRVCTLPAVLPPGQPQSRAGRETPGRRWTAFSSPPLATGENGHQLHDRSETLTSSPNLRRLNHNGQRPSVPQIQIPINTPISSSPISAPFPIVLSCRPGAQAPWFPCDPPPHYPFQPSRTVSLFLAESPPPSNCHRLESASAPQNRVSLRLWWWWWCSPIHRAEQALTVSPLLSQSLFA